MLDELFGQETEKNGKLNSKKKQETNKPDEHEEIEKLKTEQKDFSDPNNWRLLTVTTKSYKEQMAIDEANMEAVASGKSPPILRICHFKKPAVSIGFFQMVNKEVNVDLCKKKGVEVFRRMTGGGAVYKDPQGELNYSFIAPEADPRIPLDILKSYKKICGAVIKGLNEELAIKCEFKPINDILLNGKKISGNAQTRKGGVLLQHGTILIDIDYNKMFSFLKVPKAKIKDKNITDVKDRVTSLRKELGRKVTMEEVRLSVIRGFEDTFHVQFLEDELSKEEIAREKFLYEYKYDTDEWNFWK